MKVKIDIVNVHFVIEIERFSTTNRLQIQNQNQSNPVFGFFLFLFGKYFFSFDF